MLTRECDVPRPAISQFIFRAEPQRALPSANKACADSMVTRRPNILRMFYGLVKVGIHMKARTCAIPPVAGSSAVDESA